MIRLSYIRNLIKGILNNTLRKINTGKIEQSKDIRITNEIKSKKK